MVNDVSRSLVSLWANKDSLDPHYFLCSGVFVADRKVLTTKHVFENRRPTELWVRPLTDSLQAYAIDADPLLHPKHDVALVCIAATPPKTPVLELEIGDLLVNEPNAYELFGYFEGRLETQENLTVRSFDAATEHYITSPSHAKGYSGAAMCAGGKLWAISVARYINENRGCVVAMHQIWDGWLDRLIPVKPTHTRSIGELQRALTDAIKQALKDAFASPSLRDQTLIPIKGGIPDVVSKTLLSDRGNLGRESVFALLDLTKSISKGLQEQTLNLSANARDALRQSLHDAMGSAARLCVDLEHPSANEPDDSVQLIPANTEPGAMVVTQSKPHHSWGVGTQDGVETLISQNIIHAPIEMAEGNDRKDDIARLIHQHLDPTGRVPDEISDRLTHSLRGRLLHEADEGRKRFLVLKPDDVNKVAPELQEWMCALGLGLISLTGGDNTLFLFDEDHLVGKLHGFLSEFKKPEWKTR